MKRSHRMLIAFEVGALVLLWGSMVFSLSDTTSILSAMLAAGFIYFLSGMR